MTLDKTRTKVTAVERPYTVSFRHDGSSYLATSEEVQRLLDGYPIVAASPYKVVIEDPEAGADEYRRRVELGPATMGGGPAFVIERGR